MTRNGRWRFVITRKRSWGGNPVFAGPSDKLLLFMQDTVDPFSVLSAGFNAGLDQAVNQDC